MCSFCNLFMFKRRKDNQIENIHRIIHLMSVMPTIDAMMKKEKTKKKKEYKGIVNTRCIKNRLVSNWVFDQIWLNGWLLFCISMSNIRCHGSQPRSNRFLSFVCVCVCVYRFVLVRFFHKWFITTKFYTTPRMVNWYYVYETIRGRMVWLEVV